MRDLRLSAPARLVALTGANGAGKTNILEAISLLAPGRGLRGAPFEELARQGGRGSWAIAAEIETRHGPVSLGTGWSGQSEAGDGGGRLVVIDGEVQKGSGALGEHMRLLWLTPARTGSSRGPPPTAAASSTAWWRPSTPSTAPASWSSKRSCASATCCSTRPAPTPAWLSSLEAQMAEAAVAISAARLVGLEALQTHIGEGRAESSFPWAELAVEGEIEALVGPKASGASRGRIS